MVNTSSSVFVAFSNAAEAVRMAITEVRTVGESENNGEMGVVLADLERICGVFVARSKPVLVAGVSIPVPAPVSAPAPEVENKPAPAAAAQDVKTDKPSVVKGVCPGCGKKCEPQFMTNGHCRRDKCQQKAGQARVENKPTAPAVVSAPESKPAVTAKSAKPAPTPAIIPAILAAIATPVVPETVKTVASAVDDTRDDMLHDSNVDMARKAVSAHVKGSGTASLRLVCRMIGQPDGGTEQGLLERLTAFVKLDERLNAANESKPAVVSAPSETVKPTAPQSTQEKDNAPCKGKTKNGQTCGMVRVTGSEYCRHHKGQNTASESKTAAQTVKTPAPAVVKPSDPIVPGVFDKAGNQLTLSQVMAAVGKVQPVK